MDTRGGEPRGGQFGQPPQELAPGWFVNTNIANRQKALILRAACEAAGLVFGRDLQIELPNAGQD